MFSKNKNEIKWFICIGCQDKKKKNFKKNVFFIFKKLK